jgi:hypothetical protein
MRDAVNLIDNFLQLKEVKYKIKKIYFVPETSKLYLGLQKPDGIIINYQYEDLLPFIIEQIKL